MERTPVSFGPGVFLLRKTTPALTSFRIRSRNGAYVLLKSQYDFCGYPNSIQHSPIGSRIECFFDGTACGGGTLAECEEYTIDQISNLLGYKGWLNCV